MELLLSTNINNIRLLKDKNILVAASEESARILLKAHKIDRIIEDNIRISNTDIPVVNIKEYKYAGKIKKILRQEVVSVCSSKGGLGKTSLVKAMADILPEKTLIIDMNCQDGGSDLSFEFDLPLLPHLGTYLKDRTKKGFLQNIIKYKDNIYVLQAPPKKSLAENISEKDVAALLSFARSEFDIVLIDMPNILTDTLKMALSLSTRILVLSKGLSSEMKRIKENFNDLDIDIIFVKPEQGYKKLADMLDIPYIKVNDIHKDIVKIINKIF